MLTGIGLDALDRKITENSRAKKDFVVNTEALEMIVRGHDDLPTLLIPQEGNPFPLQPLAHNQLGDRLGIPNKYYQKMLADAPDLLASNVNTWFRKNPEKRMLRTLRDEVRAVLSNRYQRIDHHEVAAAALPVLRELPGVQLLSCEVTDRRLYIHFTVATVYGEVKKGDIVQAGGIISNSEVGCGSVQVSGLLWRLICLNGMKTTEAFRKYHTGKHIEDTGEIDWSDDTRQADDRAVLLKVRDMVRAVVDETRFRASLLKMQGLVTDGKVTGDPSKAVEVLAQKMGVAESERGGILRSLFEGGDLTRWGVLNAVTAQAHAATDYDRAVDFEAMGGKLLDLPTKDWKEILEAA